MNNVFIRKSTSNDMASVLDLIKELAAYEKAPNEVELDVETLIDDGFGEHKIFDCLVAEEGGQIIGFALFYTKYSTWKGKCLFLEDFIVSDSKRGLGTGKLLFEAVVQEAKSRKVKRMEWQVLDWNEPAINFYKKFNATLDPEWVNGKLTYNQLQDY